MRNRLIIMTAMAALTLAALPAFAQGGGQHKFFDRMDANLDGSLSQDEIQKQFPKFTPEYFKQADSNGDGKLSVAEWQGFVKAKRAERKSGGGLM